MNFQLGSGFIGLFALTMHMLQYGKVTWNLQLKTIGSSLDLVVQSIVSLTKSLVKNSLNIIVLIKSTVAVIFAKNCKTLLLYFSHFLARKYLQ